MKDPRQSDVRESTVVLVCRDIDLNEEDRKEIERSEAALAHVFPKIHRIEWTVTARPRAVEVHVQMHARGGDFEARASEKDARTALQGVTKKVLAQKRNQKEALLGLRRDETPPEAAAGWR
ncbi:MAG: HPF/RaiA family ribosome-associated protein [Vicinamibacteria bacterium]